MTIQGQAFPRAGLIGNPSDGYFGKTISFTFRNFSASVRLEESDVVEILPGDRDHPRYASLDDLARDVRLHGYYGGVRLLKATVKSFRDHCSHAGLHIPRKNFRLSYETTIPAQLGLAGSSAIVTACFRVLMSFYNIDIPRPVLANLVLWTETKELGIPAGLQDRVAQVYDGLVYMDFNKSQMERQGYGQYEWLDLDSLPPLYIAYETELAEGTEVFHNDIRTRWERGERDVVEAMRTWASLALQVRELLLKGEGRTIGPLLNANFDLRRKIYRISDDNVRMVETARSTGASAKFTGSGGAIVGTYEDEDMFRRLAERLGAIGVQVIKPEFVRPK